MALSLLIYSFDKTSLEDDEHTVLYRKEYTVGRCQHLGIQIVKFIFVLV